MKPSFLKVRRLHYFRLSLAVNQQWTIQPFFQLTTFWTLPHSFAAVFAFQLILLPRERAGLRRKEFLPDSCHPPIWLMPRCEPADTATSISWCSGLFAMACWKNSSSGLPLRTASRKETSAGFTKQERNLPSEVNRNRLQFWQKCSPSGEINPTVPSASGMRNVRAGPLPTGEFSGWRLNAESWVRISWTET